MTIAQQVLAVNDDLPIRTDAPVHSGKVRSVYWLTESDSARLIDERGYDVPADTPLAIMVISDRLSAFDCIWQGEGGLAGVPGKGAALNAISHYWFELFKAHGLANSHILEVPHPLVWIVRKAQPVKIEAIARNYITGSMWRAYSKGERHFCGIELPEGLEKDQKLPKLLITPSTKGILKGIPGVPEADDVNISRSDIVANYPAFNFLSVDDVNTYERFLIDGFKLIESALARAGQIFVDTKFEFGYVTNSAGQQELIYMDEVGTPDSSRMWDAQAHANGKVIENSKEGFRQRLLNHFPDADILLNKERMGEREKLAAENQLPAEFLLDVSNTYVSTVEKIIGRKLKLSKNPRAEIIEILGTEFGLVD
jgi:phosphoribosylaminoimidazole-succinocarboxamide synthase